MFSDFVWWSAITSIVKERIRYIVIIVQAFTKRITEINFHGINDSICFSCVVTGRVAYLGFVVEFHVMQNSAFSRETLISQVPF